ncbi:hypothetical protein [Bifidobacterium jacchi]|uniref:hypothetical protein n=1 Tax=Bifidobacterium jacchi TaxID=2490545 RepID=UPI001F4F1C86|nr:hypothetical protein [Bifidobacterium jacchi]
MNCGASLAAVKPNDATVVDGGATHGASSCTLPGGVPLPKNAAHSVTGTPPMPMPQRPAASAVAIQSASQSPTPSDVPLKVPDAPGVDPGTKVMLAILSPVLVGLAVLLVMIVFSMSMSSETTKSGTQTQSSSDSSQSSSSYYDDDSSNAESQSTSCDADPDMQVVSVESVGNDLVVTVLVTPSADCGSDATITLDDDSTRVTLSDSNGDTVADAVFDFSSDTQVIPSEGKRIKLSYAPTQFYRPATELEREFEDDPSELIVKYIYAAPVGSGASTSSGPSSQSGALGGKSASDDESEQDACSALQWQVSQDKSKASDFVSTTTTQLSSKRQGMVVDGKTWSCRDILAQFITLRDKHPNSLLIWSGDWPNYDSNSTKYYVILSGESFDSTDDAWNWCHSNNYGFVDCYPVNLN